MTVSLTALPERIAGKLTPYGCFAQQRRDARKRGIPFEFTFNVWVQWWETNLGSNWPAKRGHRSGQYVMARNNDTGPYAPWNVKCITSNENHHEGNIGKPRPKSKQHILNHAASIRGRKLTKEHKEKIGKALKGKMKGIPKSAEHRAKLSAAKMGIKFGTHSEEAKLKIRNAKLAYWAKRRASTCQ